MQNPEFLPLSVLSSTTETWKPASLSWRVNLYFINSHFDAQIYKEDLLKSILFMTHDRES